jgi:hypothetical protein
MPHQFEKHDIRDSIVYYNINIPGGTPPLSSELIPQPVPATFQEVRQTPLFYGDADDYYLSVVRFTVPTSFIPLFIAPIQPYPNLNPNLMVHSVTLSYSGNDFQTFLIFIPQNRFVPVPPSPTQGEGIIRNNYILYYGLYSYQFFLDILNAALANSYFNLNVMFPGLVPAPPFMSFSGTTDLFTLNVPTAYSTNAVEIYFNYFLAGLFQASFCSEFFGFGTPNGKDVLYVVEDLLDNHVTYNGIPYYTFEQESNTIAQFSPLNSILFLTGNLPIRTEWISYADISPYQPNLINTADTNKFLRILTDFEVDITNSSEIHSFIRYTPTAQYRYVDLLGKSTIDVIDVQIYWRDNFGNIYPLLVPFGQTCTIKILFERKKNIRKLLQYDIRN